MRATKLKKTPLHSYFPGVQHNAGKMLTQPTSLKRLFFDRSSGGTTQPSLDGGSIMNGTVLKFWSTSGRVSAKQLAALGQHVVQKKVSSGATASSALSSPNATSSPLSQGTARQGVTLTPSSASSALPLAVTSLLALSLASVLLLVATF